MPLHPLAVLPLDAPNQPTRLVSTDHAYGVRRIVTVPFSPRAHLRSAPSTAEACVEGTDRRLPIEWLAAPGRVAIYNKALSQLGHGV